MSHAIIKFRHGFHGDNRVTVDGIELAHMTETVSIALNAVDIPRITLSVFLTSCEIDTQGDVEINAKPINDEIGRAILASLKAHYERPDDDSPERRYWVAKP